MLETKEIEKNGLIDFQNLMEEVAELSKEKQEKVCIFVQGIIAGMQTKKLN
ncbi:hypothetical protein CLPUN_49320 [Clostridium puniceum]|uniref:Uncharacterized protein n=1 Tax=Clostridium puniceum TaxID=29367 RepID=A0A1S8T1X4_9CLOT|nr:hypothetical protein [Clostridium puniceum]OOM71465.1 hypothetical protein CLPUN_49320 [Clostridium puniceum]